MRFEIAFDSLDRLNEGVVDVPAVPHEVPVGRPVRFGLERDDQSFSGPLSVKGPDDVGQEAVQLRLVAGDLTGYVIDRGSDRLAFGLEGVQVPEVFSVVLLPGLGVLAFPVVHDRLHRVQAGLHCGVEVGGESAPSVGGRDERRGLRFEREERSVHRLRLCHDVSFAVGRLFGVSLDRAR
nr:hypothetical protein [Glycomyces salinus]